MLLNIAGRVSNVRVPYTKPLLPLFEAISNSFDAIKDAGEEKGRIDVFIIRDEASLFSPSKIASERQLAEISGFIVQDNGIGFDEKNYREFNIGDTRNKASQGGKGIGRFMYLAAFNQVEISSVYIANNQAKQRKFIFTKNNDDGIENHSCIDVPITQRLTTVKLLNLRKDYQKHCPKRTDIIAAYIVEQFLDVFFSSSCPKIVLHDDFVDKQIDLDEFYDDEMVINSNKESILIKNQQFDIVHVQLHSNHIPEHRMYFCARESVVKSEKLVGIPNMESKLKDSDGQEFVYAVYISSIILDESVNSERIGFNLSEEDGGLIPEEITLDDIKKAVLEHSKIYLSPFTEPIKRRKDERINRFVSESGIMYRPILKRIGYIYDTITPEATDDEIDAHLYQGYQELRAKLRAEGQNLALVETEAIKDIKEFEKRFDEYVEKITEINSADLTRYVWHRKMVIEFLKLQLGYKENDKYHREERIHSIIFPLAKTSNEVMFEEHNLWLIDERLGFHAFLGSDKPIFQQEPLINGSKKSPDIMVFNKALAFGEQSEIPFNSITIIEFKKPLRNEYSEEENPFYQVNEYVKIIKNGKAIRKDGRPIAASNIPIYCYVICDITENLKKWAEIFDLETTPDGYGYFGYRRNPEAYWEVISFSKLVSDAEKRHYAFFEKLGLPKSGTKTNF